MTPNPESPTGSNWRFVAGVSALILAALFPLSAFLVPLFGLSPGEAALLSGFLLAGAPEILIIASVALMGKENFDRIMQWAKHFFIGRFFEKPASKLRYCIGLTIAILSLFPIYLVGYASSLMPTGDARIFLLAGADLAFLLSVFLMGREFWGKFRSIFIWNG
jgi:hypothetical protein